MSAIISVQLDRVEALAAELAALAAALPVEAPLCSSTAGSLSTSLAGEAGWWAAGASHGWAGLLQILGQRSDAIASTLSGAVAAYRSADTALAQRVGPGRLGTTAIAR